MQSVLPAKRTQQHIDLGHLTAVINKMTNAALDPFAKIPEFKYCAIRMEQGGVAPVATSYGGGQILAKRT